MSETTKCPDCGSDDVTSYEVGSHVSHECGECGKKWEAEKSER